MRKKVHNLRNNRNSDAGGSKDGWKAADPTDTARDAQQGFYGGSGEASLECAEYFGGGAGIANGAVKTIGENTAGCEHFEFYCESPIPCWRSGGSFPSAVKEAFDIDSSNFGGYWAAKVTVPIPPEGETREVFLHYHSGGRGAGSSKARMWVHEMTKDKRDYSNVNSAYTGNPRQPSMFHRA